MRPHTPASGLRLVRKTPEIDYDSLMPGQPNLQARHLRLEALVGTGSFAEVWRARDPQGNVVALKRMLPHVARNSSAVSAFEREAKLLGRVDHPGIPCLIASGTDPAGSYIILEYIEGSSLSALIGEPVNERLALRVAHDVLAALETVHELHDDEGHRLGLVHRDLSPGNVLVSVNGKVKLTDFGIARAHIGTLATTGVMARGTLGYMSPEQARGEPLDGRSDLFSVGALLLELLSGRPAYDEDDAKLALARARAGDVKVAAEALPGAHPALCDLIDRALSARPADRFPSASAMRAEVLLVCENIFREQGLATDEEVGAWAATARRKETPVSEVAGVVASVDAPRRTRAGLAIAAALLLVAAIIAVALSQRSGQREHAAAPVPSATASASAAASEPAASPSTEPAPNPSASAAPGSLPKAATSVTRGPEPTSANAEQGWVDIGSEPSFAYVTIDGKPAGSTPLFGLRLKPGQHVVVVRREGLGSKVITFELRPGEHVSKVVKLP
jgi:eukaryotic-like serine/threonine-protein kinase